MAAIIIGELCPYCQKHRSPRDIVHLPAGVKICTTCEQRHNEAVEMLLTQKFDGSCSECELPIRELIEQKRAGPHGEMACHYENGRYRAMCLVCDRDYVRKRTELYAGTEFGRSLKKE